MFDIHHSIAVPSFRDGACGVEESPKTFPCHSEERRISRHCEPACPVGRARGIYSHCEGGTTAAISNHSDQTEAIEHYDTCARGRIDAVICSHCKKILRIKIIR